MDGETWKKDWDKISSKLPKKDEKAGWDDDTKFKYDKTRLLNLLRDYRDHMITVRATNLKYIEITDHIEAVDDAINTIKFCMNHFIMSD